MDTVRSLDPFDTGLVAAVIAAIVCAVVGGSLSTVVLVGAAAFGLIGTVLSMLHEPDLSG